LIIFITIDNVIIGKLLFITHIIQTHIIQAHIIF